LKKVTKQLIPTCILLLLVLTYSLAQTPVEMYGQLSVKGTNIVDKNGNPVQLRGMSLFWSQWIPKYYNANAIKWLKDDWCLNVIRASMAADSANGGYAKNASIAETEKNKVITVVDAAIELGIYVIIDFHSHNAHFPVNRAAAKAFFAEISDKYKGVPNVIYEPWNEPIFNTTIDAWTTTIKPYHIEIIDIIRANDPNSLIVCGTRSWSQKVDEAAYSPIDRPNIAYTLHFYANTHKQELRNTADDAIYEGIALFVTEYGTCDASGNGGYNEAETRKWWRYLDENKISYCNWSVADKVETASALLPGASPNGNWAAEDLTQSGTIVKADMIAKCTSPTGIEDANLSEAEMAIYPIPFNTNMTINCAGNFDYTIQDLNGKEVANGTGTNYVLTGEKLPVGMYVVKLSKGQLIKYIKTTKSN
jgi:endoglucanase